MEDRLSEIARLVERRRRAPYVGYNCIGDYHGGIFECDYVSPYSKSAHNLDARVMVFLQDWSSDDRLQRAPDPEIVRLGLTPDLPTNWNLVGLLRTHLGLELRDTYSTNLFPFIKRGNLSSRIPRADLARAAEEFALPQVGAVRPQLAICLGLATFNALRAAAGHPPAPTVASALRWAFRIGPTQVVFQAHTGNLGRNNRNRGGIDRVSADWSAMRMLLGAADV